MILVTDYKEFTFKKLKKKKIAEYNRAFNSITAGNIYQPQNES